MGEEQKYYWSSVAPPMGMEREEEWRQLDKSSTVNAVSFGFVATAILICMFLVMAIYERFLRPASSSSSSITTTSVSDVESQPQPVLFHFPSPKITIYSKEVSVLMPGEDIPTFIALPLPAPSPPEPILKPF